MLQHTEERGLNGGGGGGSRLSKMNSLIFFI